MARKTSSKYQEYQSLKLIKKVNSIDAGDIAELEGMALIMENVILSKFKF